MVSCWINAHYCSPQISGPTLKQENTWALHLVKVCHSDLIGNWWKRQVLDCNLECHEERQWPDLNPIKRLWDELEFGLHTWSPHLVSSPDSRVWLVRCSYRRLAIQCMIWYGNIEVVFVRGFQEGRRLADNREFGPWGIHWKSVNFHFRHASKQQRDRLSKARWGILMMMQSCPDSFDTPLHLLFLLSPNQAVKR